MSVCREKLPRHHNRVENLFSVGFFSFFFFFFLTVTTPKTLRSNGCSTSEGILVLSGTGFFVKDP